MTHTDWEKKYFEANLLDGADIHDCGGAMIRADAVWEVVKEILSHAVAERDKKMWEELNHGGYCQACGFRIDICDEKPCRVRKILSSLTPQETGERTT